MKNIKNYPTQPQHVWECFYQLTQTPRPSKKEVQVIKYLTTFAAKENLKYKVDGAKNVIIYVPGTAGKEQNVPVIIQNHVDMVCDKIPEKTFDFEKDPIDIYVQDGWIHANGTTLGADNGFGCAMALAVACDKKIAHPPLELLFTTDEETGLNGALNLDASLLKGRKMINLDTEEWGAIYIGCAGGIDAKLSGKTHQVVTPKNHLSYVLEIKNLKGGHSGLDIHRGRLNAIVVLAQVLWEAQKLDYSIASISGGKAHNIIPRDVTCKLTIKKEDYKKFQTICSQVLEDLQKNALPEDRDIQIQLTQDHGKIRKVLPKKQRDRIVNLLNLFPHGAYNYDWNLLEPLVTSSSNLAIVKLENNDIFIETSMRFIDPMEVKNVKNKIAGLAFNFNLSLEMNEGYPSWKPVHDNKLLDLAKAKFHEIYGVKPSVKAIHAGLECGILKNKLGEMDIISIGPNISGAHSPTERLEIKSASQLWDYLAAILKEL